MEMDHQKAMVDGTAKKKKFLNYSEEELKMPPSSADHVSGYFTNEWKEETTQIKTKMFNNTMHLWFFSISCMFFIYLFTEHHSCVRKTRNVLDAIQQNANRLCVPQGGEIVIAEREQGA
jgi:hypothetical protein